MKKHILASAILSSAFGLAHADDGNSITLYGVLDVAVGAVEHSPNGSAFFPATVNPVSKVSTAFNHSVIGMFNGGISDSRWGIRGNEDLGGNLHAFFGLESGINVPTGNINNGAASVAGSNNTVGAASALSGQIFNRGAFVGLRHDTYGSVQLGRTTTLGFDTILNYDPVFAAQLFFRSDSRGLIRPVALRKGRGRTTTSSIKTTRVRSIMASRTVSAGLPATTEPAPQSAPTWDMRTTTLNQATYYSARDAIHSGALVGANPIGSPLTGANVGALTLANDEDVMIAAKYAIGAGTIKVGYERFELRAPSDPVGPGVTTNYFGFSGTLTNTVNPTKSNVYFAGGDYKFTPRLDVAGGFYDTQTVQSTGVAGGNQLQYSTPCRLQIYAPHRRLCRFHVLEIQRGGV